MRENRYFNSSVCISVIMLLMVVIRVSASVVGTAHDFSPGKDGSQACQFCHTPHMALSNTPLWNHKLSDAVYEIYSSSSLDADVGQPTGSSKLCLSCHDGTVALEADVRGGAGRTYMPPGKANIGTDLSDDHPISFVYSSVLSGKDSQLRDPLTLPDEVPLDRFSEMQCVTCHDPHDDTFGDFLVTTNIKSNLCLKCHDLSGWTESIHATSVETVELADDDYLKQTGYLTVSDNGCLCCHQPHSAGGHERLFHFAKEEDNCLNCHNGQVAQNIADELMKFSGHFVGDYEGIHDIMESPGAFEHHVECQDCHNPHAVTKGFTAVAPNIKASLKSVSGVTDQGNPISNALYEYEICFKCHGNNAVDTGSVIPRQITQMNTILEFDQGNPSFHPVTGQGINTNVPSLYSGIDVSTIIYCTDCHNSDTSAQAKGPHGSIHPFLLAFQYSTEDETEESVFAYELCYQCHDRESILGDKSFKGHEKHIVDEKTPCSACHDPHGISSSQGNSMNNTNLINLDSTIVFPDPITGRLEFEDLGTFRGQCFLECHGTVHSPKAYEP